jgi:pimeloyl-ACP methyl ester carboxylesterase
MVALRSINIRADGENFCLSTINVNGANIWYELKGKGGRPVIAQIHGAGFGHDNFAPVSPLLLKEYQVLDYDLRGYGLSDRPLQKYGMEVWADDLAAMLDALEVEKAHIHGTSMGGMIALQFAMEYPNKVRSLIVGCTAAKSDYASKVLFKSWIDIAEAQGCGSELLGEVIGYEALSREFLETEEGQKTLKSISIILGKNNRIEVFRAACESIINLDLTPKLYKIKAPTLIMVGDKDIMTPMHQAPSGAGSDVIHNLISGSKLEIIKGCGHTFLFERPEESAEIILRFLRKN